MPTPKAGYRLKDGTRVPGTTTVIGRFKNADPLMYWAFEQGRNGANSLYEKRDEAADVGTQIHALVEAHINGLALPEMPEEFTEEQRAQVHDGFDAFLRWERHCRLVVVEQEFSLVSEKYRYGGTPDAVGMIDDALAMLDWKSSRDIHYDYLIQLAAYVHLYQENFPDRSLNGGIHICRFGKSGGEFFHHHYPANHPKLKVAWEQFRLFRQAYENDKALRK